MQSLYIIRLAETVMNRKGIISGRKMDSPLTREGLELAYRVADLLSPLPSMRRYMISISFAK